MCERWQQFVPFWIDRFFGSSAVQAMDPAAAMGYWALICRQWQSDDCTISADPMDLAQDSRLGDEKWAQFGPRILRNFQEVAPGRLRNEVTFTEWEEARKKFEANHEKRSKAGKQGADARWKDGKPMANATEDMANATENDGKTWQQGQGQEQGQEQKDEKQNPAPRASASERPNSAGRARKRDKTLKPKTKTALQDERYVSFKEAIRAYWDSKNPNVEMVWGPMEGQQLNMWLREAPHVTLPQFRGFLRNRYLSEVNHGERASQWIRWVTVYGDGPVDRFGKPKDEAKGVLGGGNHKARTSGNYEALRNALEELPEESADGASRGETGSDNRGNVEVIRPPSGKVRA